MDDANLNGCCLINTKGEVQARWLFADSAARAHAIALPRALTHARVHGGLPGPPDSNWVNPADPYMCLIDTTYVFKNRYLRVLVDKWVQKTERRFFRLQTHPYLCLNIDSIYEFKNRLPAGSGNKTGSGNRAPVFPPPAGSIYMFKYRYHIYV